MSIVLPEFAVSEGQAYFWASAFIDNPLGFDAFNSFADTAWINLEDGEAGLRGTLDTTYHTANALGKVNEGAVAGMLWDIYDNDIGLEEHSSLQDWGVTTLPHSPDGIGDSLSDGIDNILKVLLDRTVFGHHPDNIDEFWDSWFGPLQLGGHVPAMRDIWYEHGELQGCCVGIRGNVNGDPNDEIDISDLDYLVSFMFDGGPAPPCMEEGNINGSADGLIDISDLTYFVAFMFGGGPAPPACP